MKKLLFVSLFAFTCALLAQTNTIPLPGATTAVPTVELGKLLIAVIVPIVVAGIKKAVSALTAKTLPVTVIPIIAVACGAAADYVGSLVGAWHFSLLAGLVLGAAGVGLREAAVKLGAAALKD